MKPGVEQKKEFGAIILAGGKSRRFGTDKAVYSFQGNTLIENVIKTVEQVTQNIIVISNSPDKMRFLKYPVFEDIIQGAGPLGGIYTGLINSHFELNLVLPCDMPHISIECLNFLIANTNGNDITVPIHNNRLEPLCAVYSKSCIPHIKNQIESKDVQVFQFYDKVKTLKIPFSGELPFYNDRLFSNINFMKDLAELSIQ